MLTTIVLWILGFIAALILLRFALRLLGVLFAKWLANALLGGVGADALASQPDELHLEPAPNHVWSNNAAVTGISEPLAGHGFTEAGTFEIDAMPDAFVRFLVSPAEGLCCAIYEHPKIGVWFDLYTRYEDGTSTTFTTAKPSGLDRQPGFTTVNAPGASAETMYRRILKERKPGTYTEITASNVVPLFEDAYKREITWRKGKGISGAEVARVEKAREVESAA
jgi:hypothetical protein